MTPTHPTQASVGEVRHTPAVIAAARAMCKNASDICNVNDDDNWKIYGDQFLNEAQIALNAAGFPDLLEALQTLVSRIEFYAAMGEERTVNIEQWEYTEGSADMAKARAAIARATSLPNEANHE